MAEEELGDVWRRLNAENSDQNALKGREIKSLIWLKFLISSPRWMDCMDNKLLRHYMARLYSKEVLCSDTETANQRNGSPGNEKSSLSTSQLITALQTKNSDNLKPPKLSSRFIQLQQQIKDILQRPKNIPTQPKFTSSQTHTSKPLHVPIYKNKPTTPVLPIRSERSSLHRDEQMDFSTNQNQQFECEDLERKNAVDSFRTAREQLIINDAIKNKRPIPSYNLSDAAKKSLGPRRGKFVPPIQRDENESNFTSQITQRVVKSSGDSNNTGSNSSNIEIPEELSHLDAKLVELIMNEIMDSGTALTWDDIAGLSFAKKTIREIIVLPMLRPDIFTGLRGPPKGLLLFGPPGTGKTLIGKCIASQSKCTFFSISASSLTSKWVGEGEKMVRTLFSVARYKQPAVVFIDEIDSLLTQRSESEHESTRRIKTEFLVQMDGVGCQSSDRILIIGATNRPQELDEAARRRFVKRLYIPLPECEARLRIITNLIQPQDMNVSEEELQCIVTQTKGYSGADVSNLCKEAALGPVRDISFEDIETVTIDQVRKMNLHDFKQALKQVRPSVDQSEIIHYLDWNKKFGSWDIPNNYT